MTRLLEVSGLHKSYGGVRAVDDVSFSVGPGEVIGLVGPNGAGKTTLVDCIFGTQQADSGTVALAGAPLTGPSERRARQGLSRTFQHPQLAAELDAVDNIIPDCTGTRSPHRCTRCGGRSKDLSRTGTGQHSGPGRLLRDTRSPTSRVLAGISVWARSVWSRWRGRWRPNPKSSCWTNRLPVRITTASLPSRCRAIDCRAGQGSSPGRSQRRSHRGARHQDRAAQFRISGVLRTTAGVLGQRRDARSLFRFRIRGRRLTCSNSTESQFDTDPLSPSGSLPCRPRR